MGTIAPNQLSLFEFAPTLPPAPKKGERCKNCNHLYRHPYNRNLKYCSKQIVVRAGKRYIKKIGSNDAACMFFEPIETEVEERLSLEEITTIAIADCLRDGGNYTGLTADELSNIIF